MGTSTQWLMKIHIHFKKHYSNSSLHERLDGNNSRSSTSSRARASTIRSLTDEMPW
jgi:hypothetical protein